MQGGDHNVRLSSSQHLLAAAEASEFLLQTKAMDLFRARARSSFLSFAHSIFRRFSFSRCYNSDDDQPYLGCENEDVCFVQRLAGSVYGSVGFVKLPSFLLLFLNLLPCSLPSFFELTFSPSSPLALLSSSSSDGLTRVYASEGIRGLYKGSLLALVGVTNGSIQFAAYEAIKRKRADVKRARVEREGETWGPQHDMLVSARLLSPQFSRTRFDLQASSELTLVPCLVR